MKQSLSKFTLKTGQTVIPTSGFTDVRMMLRSILKKWQTQSRRQRCIPFRTLSDEGKNETLYQTLRAVDKYTLRTLLLKTQVYSTKEIATLIDLKTGALYARFGHLRKKLKKFL